MSSAAQERKVPRWVWITLGVLLVLALGVGGWVRFRLGVTAFNGTDECGACHIMQDHLRTHKASQHQGLASCDDCHVPHKSALQANMYKAKAGAHNLQALRRLRAENRKNESDIKANQETLRIVTENCWRCHDEIDNRLNAGVVIPSPHSGAMPEPAVLPSFDSPCETINCLDCHTGLVHDDDYTTPDPVKKPRRFEVENVASGWETPK